MKDENLNLCKHRYLIQCTLNDAIILKGGEDMAVFFFILGIACSLAAFIFNVGNALWLWGVVGGILAVVAFPVMFIVVPIAVMMRGEMPIYWFLIPAGPVFLWLANRNR